MTRKVQSTPLRLSLALLALFTAVSLATLAVAYFVAKSTIETTIRESLVQDLAGFRAAPSAGAVAALVEAQGRVMDPSDKIISYRDALGRIHGNGAIVRTKEGFEAVALNRSDDVAETYFTLTEIIHGGYLTLAESADARANLRQTMITVLLFSLLPSVLIALGGGLLISRRSATRLASLENTLARLTSGDLSARVPTMEGATDDLSLIARRVDKMAAAQEENVTALRQVSADIAHDLRTPIQRVALMLDKATGAQPDTAQELIAKATEEMRTIGQIFQALLQIAQLEGGDGRGGFTLLDLGTVALDVSDLYGPTAEDAGRDITVTVIDAAPVLGDRTLLGQMMANVIENALQHGGTSAKVAVDVSGRQLTISDNGPGIPEEKRDLVLQRLYRLEKSRTTPGSGLGLALVKAIAGLHGAKLELKGNDPGLRVSLIFPEAERTSSQ